MPLLRTTININDALLAELRKQASESGRPFRQVLEETLQRGLAKSASRPRKVRIQPAPVGVKPAYQGMSMNQLFDLLEQGATLYSNDRDVDRFPGVRRVNPLDRS